MRTGEDSLPEHRLPLAIPCATSAVSVYQKDVVMEHGGQLSLSRNAEIEIEQALRSVFHISGAARVVSATGTCRTSRIAGIVA